MGLFSSDRGDDSSSFFVFGDMLEPFRRDSLEFKVMRVQRYLEDVMIMETRDHPDCQLLHRHRQGMRGTDHPFHQYPRFLSSNAVRGDRLGT